MTLVLFGDPPATKVPKKFKPTKIQRRVLIAMGRIQPCDELALYNHLEGDLRPGVITKAIDTLAKKGYVKDTGERGAWTTLGRRIIWALV